jgi:diguanylate cyclase (GGDEF)-like protein
MTRGGAGGGFRGWVARMLLPADSRRTPPGPFPSDFSHVLDLLRRAHGGRAAWSVGLAAGELEAPAADRDSADERARGRGAALVRLASVDGRAHVAGVPEGGGTFIAVGDFPYGAGLLLPPDPPAERISAVIEDLRRLIAGMRLAEAAVSADETRLIAKQLGALASGAQTLEGIARAGAELAQRVCERGAVVVLQDQATRTARVVAVSTGADGRLAGLSLADGAPVVRAMQSGLPIVAQGREDVFGPGVPERRRLEREGVAYPLRDGHLVAGALVLIGPSLAPESLQAQQLQRLVVELGPRLAAAQAVHEAEQRAVRDPLTGLVNRREFERRLDVFRAEASAGGEVATLVYVDIDHFKRLNDSLGHAAGDSALRHIAGVLSAQIRDGDLVARIGGEEFAVWLPRTGLPEGLDVAERIRRAVETGGWRWSGTVVPLSASCGVASFPATVGDVNNLRVMADAALYRAKQAGRNRVEIAGVSR